MAATMSIFVQRRSNMHSLLVEGKNLLDAQHRTWK